jgi:hypothetical protein
MVLDAVGVLASKPVISCSGTPPAVEGKPVITCSAMPPAAW